MTTALSILAAVLVFSLAMGLIVAALFFIRGRDPRQAWIQVGQGLLLLLSLYPSVAWMTFTIRHPMAGQGVFWTEFRAVMTFQSVPRYR